MITPFRRPERPHLTVVPGAWTPLTLRDELGAEEYDRLAFAWHTRALDRAFLIPLTCSEDPIDPYRPTTEGFGDERPEA